MDVKPHTNKALITVKEEPDVKETFVKRVKRRGRPKLVSRQTPFCPVKEEPDVKETFVKRVKQRGRPKLVSRQTPFCPVKEEPDVKETFVKRVKCRGRPKLVSRQTPFCPPFMVRCDNDRPHFNYRTVWACRICTKLLLSKSAAISHAAICKLAITKEEDIPIADLNHMEKNMCYPCKYCDKKMRRKVIWLKHLNQHETPDYDENNWGVDDILIENLKRPDKVVSKQMKQEPDFNPSTL